MELLSILKAGEWMLKKIVPQRVLLAVDDNPADLLWLEREMQIAKLRYETAETAEEAQGLLRKMKFHAAIIDIGLPGMDGNELAKRIHDEYPKTKVFFITGSTFISLQESALIRVIRKPITASVLRELVT